MENEFRKPMTSAPEQYNAGPPVHAQQAGMEAAPIGNTKDFYVKHTSAMDGKVYEGTFTCKKLSIRDLTQLGVRKVQLNGGYHYDEKKPGCGIDPETDFMNQMMSHLEISVIRAPLWWDLNTMIDSELVGAVYKKVAEFENSFFRSNRGQNDDPGSSQIDSVSQGEATGPAGSVAQVGGGQVQASLDP